MQTDGQILRLAFQRLVQHPGIGTRQLVRVIATLADLAALIVGAEVGPDGVVQLQVATARRIESVNGIAPGLRQVVKIDIQIRVDSGVDIFAAATEMQHARAGDGHLWLGVATDALQIAEVLQHRMAAEPQLARNAHSVGFGLHAVELNALVRVVTLHALQAVEEIKMPPGTTELAIGNHLQAAGALLLYHMANRFIFYRSQLLRVDLTAGEFYSRLFDGVGT